MVHRHPLCGRPQNHPVARDTVDDLARLAAVAPLPVAAAAELELMLVVLVSPGSLDAGLGSADPPPGATIREGGRKMPAPAALPTDAVRMLAMPEVAFVPGTGLAPAPARRVAPLVLLGTTFSFAARLGRWMPANRDAGTGPTLDELELDDPAGGRPMTMPPPAMPAGGRCTPRIAGRVA